MRPRTIHLAPADIEAIAQRVAAILKGQTPADDAMLTRAQAAAHLNVSPSSFNRLRQKDALCKPTSQHPLRWSRRQLDLWRSRNIARVIGAA